MKNFRAISNLHVGILFAAVLAWNAGANVENWVSDMAWTDITNGWGPVEKDMSNGEQPAGDGISMAIEGVTFAKGLGAHSYSQIDVPLNNSWRAFSSFIGVDDEVPYGTPASIVFVVQVDGVEKFRSAVFNDYSAPESINVDVTGGTNLSLIIEDAGNGNGNDHGDWAGAKVSDVPLVQFTLTTQTQNGNITITPLNALYDSGKVVTLAAIPAYGYRFVRWTGDFTSINIQDYVTMNANKNITAVFEIIPVYRLSTTSVNGTILLNPAGGQYQQGTQVTVIPVTNPGYAFSGWSGDLSGMMNPSYVLMDTNKSITANFVASDTTWVSDLGWSEIYNGWGPVERDMSNGETGAGDGFTQSIGGTTYTKGLGAHSYSQIDVPLGGVYETFETDIGVDDEMYSPNFDLVAIVFVVQLDGIEIYRSPSLGIFDVARNIQLNVTGGQTLSLIIEDGGNGNGGDHGDWAGARVYRSSPTKLNNPRFISNRDFNIITDGDGFTINARSGVSYAVYGLDGILMQKGITTEDNEKVTLSRKKPGIYLVKINRKNQSLVKRAVFP